jgi:hypothetical protein
MQGVHEVEQYSRLSTLDSVHATKWRKIIRRVKKILSRCDVDRPPRRPDDLLVCLCACVLVCLCACVLECGERGLAIRYPLGCSDIGGICCFRRRPDDRKGKGHKGERRGRLTHNLKEQLDYSLLMGLPNSFKSSPVAVRYQIGLWLMRGSWIAFDVTA